MRALNLFNHKSKIAIQMGSHSTKSHWSLHQPWPATDSLTLALVLAGSFLFAIQGVFGANILVYLPDWIVMAIYLATGLSAIWQAMRQR
jgi:hypothetical protein